MGVLQGAVECPGHPTCLLMGRKEPQHTADPNSPPSSLLCPHIRHPGLQSPVPTLGHEVPMGQGEAAGSCCNAASGGRNGGGKERREGEGQRQVGPHVKGAGAGSYYLLGSRCPLASPGSAGSSATEHRGAVLAQTHLRPKVRRRSRGHSTRTTPPTHTPAHPRSCKRAGLH